MVACYCGSTAKNQKRHLMTKKHRLFKKDDIKVDVEENQDELNNNTTKRQDNNINLFYQQSKRAANDSTNKKREDMLCNIINDPNRFQGTVLYERLMKELKPFISKDADRLELKKFAGRGHNFDFILKQFNKHGFEIEEARQKIEFKYSKSLFHCPQAVSMYDNSKTFQMFLNDSYIDHWRSNYLPKIVGDMSKYDIDNYIKKINNTRKTFTPLQENLYKVKSVIDLDVNESIKSFLKETVRKDNININGIEKLLQRQTEKIFLCCWNGEFTIMRLTEEDMKLDWDSMSCSHNTIKIYNVSHTFYFTFLLRWKNHKGCGGPAWQIGIKLNNKK